MEQWKLLVKVSSNMSVPVTEHCSSGLYPSKSTKFGGSHLAALSLKEHEQCKLESHQCPTRIAKSVDWWEAAEDCNKQVFGKIQ